MFVERDNPEIVLPYSRRRLREAMPIMLLGGGRGALQSMARHRGYRRHLRAGSIFSVTIRTASRTDLAATAMRIMRREGDGASRAKRTAGKGRVRLPPNGDR